MSAGLSTCLVNLSLVNCLYTTFLYLEPMECSFLSRKGAPGLEERGVKRRRGEVGVEVRQNSPGGIKSQHTTALFSRL